MALVLSMAAPAVLSQGNPQAARLYEDALVRYEKKDYAGAVIQLKGALQVDKNMLPVHVLLGKALLAQGEVVAAEVALTEALRLGVNRAEVVVPLARAVSAQGKAQELVEQPRFADTGLPASTRVELLLIKAGAAGDLGDPRSAFKLIEDARAIDPGRPDSWLAEVPIRLRARQAREATVAVDKALALNPGSAEALYLKGTILHLQTDVQSALSHYDRALKIQPTHTEALVSRAGLLLDLRRPADAARDVQQLRASSPLDPRGAYLAALLSEREGNQAAARAALNEVTGLLDPVPMGFIRYRPQLLMLGGLAHYGLNQPEKAKAYLEAVQRDQPSSPVSKLLAKIYLGENKPDRAIDSLDRYLQGQPNDAQATLLLASVHMSQGRHARATGLIQQALRNQDQPAMRSMLGMGLAGAGKYAEAVAEFENVIRRDPGHVQAGSALATIYMQGGQPARAVNVAAAMVNRRPAHAGLHDLLGLAKERNGDVAGARAAFEQSAKLDPAFLSPQVHLARLDIAKGDYDRATSRLNAVLAKNDRHLEALMEMGRVSARRGQVADAQRWLEKADDHSGPDNLEPALALVDFQLAQRRPDLAREVVKRLTKKAPEALTVLVTMARVDLANGDAASARTVLTRAASTAGYDAGALLQIAALQFQAGHMPGAAYTLGKVLAERPGLMAAQVLMAEVEIRQGELAKAEQRARSVVAADPKRGTGHALLGEIAWLRNQRPAAIEAYRRAHQLDQSSESVLRLYSALGPSEPAAALQLAEQWLKTRPGDLALRRTVADAHARAGNLAAARSAYEALVKASPEDAEALNNLANVMLLMKDPDALKMAERALASKPGAPHIIGTVGWAAFKAGQADRSLQLLRDARLRDPANSDTRYFLGAVLASKGRTAEARVELEAALKAGGSFANAKDAEQLLRTLN
ncbi:MAG: PEP-CTERM system TPR-repeat protein PrsT [Betaproteobacteria bacterium]|nr:PEP-CTERM system TPR-repeat protein PrsT [Betaproteobacteria bacterium]